MVCVWGALYNLKAVFGVGLCSQEWVELALWRVGGETAEVPAGILGTSLPSGMNQNCSSGCRFTGLWSLILMSAPTPPPEKTGSGPSLRTEKWPTRVSNASPPKHSAVSSCRSGCHPCHDSCWVIRWGKPPSKFPLFSP